MKRRGGKRGLIPQGIIPLPATEAQGDEGKERNTESNGSGFVIHRKPRTTRSGFSLCFCLKRKSPDGVAVSLKM
jgi:hypothetical protein